MVLEWQTAYSVWKDRPLGQLIDFFGVPRQVMVVLEEDLVVLRYVRNSSYVTREAAGTYTGPQKGLIVHTEYWEDVEHSGSCQIDVFVNGAVRSCRDGACSSSVIQRTQNTGDRLRRSPPIIRNLT